MWTIISKFLDKISDNLERIKTIGVLIVSVLFITSLINNGCNRSEMESMVEKLTGLNISNDLLQKDIQHQDSILKAKNDSIKKLKTEITASKKQSNKLERENIKIKREYNNLAEELLRIPADSSYKFLDSIAYPFQGIKEYPFNSQQVKGMHKTYLENESLIALNDNLQDQKNELVHQIQLQDELSLETSSAMKVMEKTREDLEQVVENKDEEIEIKNKEIKKQKRRGVFKLIGVGFVSLLIGFAAG